MPPSASQCSLRSKSQQQNVISECLGPDVSAAPIPVDVTRCHARVDCAGLIRQCGRKLTGGGQQFCAQHQRSLPLGTVLGESEPAVQRRLDAIGQRARRSKGYKWYSRLKLWDESQKLGKLPQDLTDAEFEACLGSVDRFFTNHPSVQISWKLDVFCGPQSAAERYDKQKLEYLAESHRFIWFSALIFQQEMHAVHPSCTLLTITEDIFMQVLQRTNARAANHSIVRNYLQPFSGPQ